VGSVMEKTESSGELLFFIKNILKEFQLALSFQKFAIFITNAINAKKTRKRTLVISRA
jgi:hypothetical protein